jgi:hypothetical protein
LPKCVGAAVNPLAKCAAGLYLTVGHSRRR